MSDSDANNTNDTSRISPTAFYTSDAWVKIGLGDEAFSTWQGRTMHTLMDTPTSMIARITGGPDLMGMLEVRHRGMDALVADAITERGVCQVVELGSGLSARGVRMCRRFDGLTYVDADLAGMVRRKEARLTRVDVPTGYRTHVVNILHEDGASSLRALATGLDPTLPTLVVAEGLLPYFPREVVKDLLMRANDAFASVPSLEVITDCHLREEVMRFRRVSLFLRGLAAVARGGVHLHFADERDAIEAHLSWGFTHAQVVRPEAVVPIKPVSDASASMVAFIVASRA